MLGDMERMDDLDWYEMMCCITVSMLNINLQGDVDNTEVFQTGFDGARQKSYQYVAKAEFVTSLFYKQITYIACGEEHSAAVSSMLIGVLRLRG